ncbi:ParB/RepB/Spo0J family partition protein [Streptomyces sp. N2A]|uniref:ParB/RepB/Spo0J family partition protein n=1 Tax=Streptomyces sp. N2A TaxID=3073936 RepID=UPI00286FE4C3|nr:ParB/RepB/Spo0J family partition protein [Streptomyces sp. N2A]
MSRARDRLAVSSSFSHASQVSARRQAIAAATEAPTAGTEAAPRPELPLKLISENPDNPREKVGDVSDLVATLKEIGLVQAITVATVEAYLRSRPERAKDLEPGAQYVVVDGHRRHAAAREAGWESIKYTVNDDFVATDERLLEAAFVANLQRENLSDLEEAAALEKLVEHYGSQRKAAQRLGVTQAFISQRLSLLKLDPVLQADLESGERKVEHVRGLAGLSPEDQRKKADERRETSAKKAERRGPAPVSQPAADNAVITPAPAASPTQADNGDIASATEAGGGAGDNGVITQAPSNTDTVAAVPAARNADRKAAVEDEQHEGETIDWQDATSVAAAITRSMQETEIARLLKLLGERYPVTP